MTAEPVAFSPGVLARDQLAELVESKAIGSNNFGPPEVGAAAVDLRLGRKAWRLKEGNRLTARDVSQISSNPKEEVALIPDEKVGDYFQFDTKQIYLVELDHYLKLPENISGRATGKSSIGRLDIITRLIVPNGREYDLVEAGYEGQLHLMLVPQTFGIRIAPGESLNQLRLFSGPHWSSVIPRSLVRHFGRRLWHVLKDGVQDEYMTWPPKPPAEKPDASAIEDPWTFDLTVDLADPQSTYVFRAKKEGERDQQFRHLDLREKAKARYDPDTCFDRIAIKDKAVVLEAGNFYIMKSRERLDIPLDVAVEVLAISERIGDIRIHYAGFAHPGFGWPKEGEPEGTRKGTPLIFEVRATDMDTKLTHGSLLARIQLFRMSKESTPDVSAYNRQELTLSKLFRSPG